MLVLPILLTIIIATTVLGMSNVLDGAAVTAIFSGIFGAISTTAGVQSGMAIERHRQNGISHDQQITTQTTTQTDKESGRITTQTTTGKAGVEAGT